MRFKLDASPANGYGQRTQDHQTKCFTSTNRAAQRNSETNEQ
jgi:hypothetical protein